MTENDLLQQLTLRGIAAFIRREEVVVETCRFCGNHKHNLELNPGRGLFHCWSCNAGGRLDQLLSEWLGHAVHIPVQGGRNRTPKVLAEAVGFASVAAYDNDFAAHYLQTRRVTEGTALRYGLVVCTEKGHQLYGRLVFPLVDFWSGVTIGYVGRSMVGAKPKYLSTLNLKMVVGYRQRAASVPCVMVEGMFDALPVQLAGYQAAVLLGTSGPQVEKFAARLDPTTPLVVMLDGEAGDEADRLRWTLQPIRETPIPVVALPAGWDPGELASDVVRKLVQRALSGASATN